MDKTRGKVKGGFYMPSYKKTVTQNAQSLAWTL